MPSPYSLRGKLAKLLDRLVRAQRQPRGVREAAQERIAAEIRDLPRDGFLEAIREAIGNNRRRRRAAVYFLGERMDVWEILPYLGETIQDPDPEWRKWIVETIEAEHLFQFADRLSHLIRQDTDPAVRQAAIHAAATLKAPANLPALLEVAGLDPAELRGCLVWTLKEYACEECREYLSRVFERPAEDEGDLEDRVIAAWGLGKLQIWQRSSSWGES